MCVLCVGGSSWFVCGVFCGVVCLFPLGLYLYLVSVLDNLLPPAAAAVAAAGAAVGGGGGGAAAAAAAGGGAAAAAQEASVGCLGLVHLHKYLLLAATFWGCADVILVINLHLLHLPVSPLPSDLHALAVDYPLEVLKQQLQQERQLLAASAFIFSLCGVSIFLIILICSKADFTEAFSLASSSRTRAAAAAAEAAAAAATAAGAATAANLHANVFGVHTHNARERRRTQDEETKKIKFVKHNLRTEVNVHSAVCMHACMHACMHV